MYNCHTYYIWEISSCTESITDIKTILINKYVYLFLFYQFVYKPDIIITYQTIIIRQIVLMCIYYSFRLVFV